jgi:hypothetical protein
MSNSWLPNGSSVSSSPSATPWPGGFTDTTRRIIIALSRNDSPGPFVGKEGLGYELGSVLDHWRDHGHFTLLHDLTSVLRIMDVTEIQGNGFRMLREVKANPRASAGRQIKRAEAALAAIDGRNPLPAGDLDTQTYLWRSAAQMRTHVRQLGQLIDQASRHSFWVGKAGDRVAGVVNLLVAAQSGQDPVAHWTAYEERRGEALNRYLPASIHQLRAVSADVAARDPATAPYGIYPLPAWQRAGLICDYLIVEAIMTELALMAAMRSAACQQDCFCLRQAASGRQGRTSWKSSEASVGSSCTARLLPSCCLSG